MHIAIPPGHLEFCTVVRVLPPGGKKGFTSHLGCLRDKVSMCTVSRALSEDAENKDFDIREL